MDRLIYFDENSPHWRYFFSIKGGVQLDKGIYLKEDDTAELCRVSKNDIKHVFQRFNSFI